MSSHVMRRSGEVAPCIGKPAAGPKRLGLSITSTYKLACIPSRLNRSRLRCLSPSNPSSTIGSVVKTSSSEFRWGTYTSRASELEGAVNDSVAKIAQSIGDSKPELAIVFVSSAHGDEFDKLVSFIRQRVPSVKYVYGCSGYGVIGGNKSGPIEVEGDKALSLTLGSLPGVQVRVLHTLRSSIPDEDASPEKWSEFVGLPLNTVSRSSFVVMADPRFAQIRELMAGLDYAYPDSPKIGALVSSGTRSKQRAMFAWSLELVEARRQAVLAEQQRAQQETKEQPADSVQSQRPRTPSPSPDTTTSTSQPSGGFFGPIKDLFSRVNDAIREAKSSSPTDQSRPSTSSPAAPPQAASGSRRGRAGQRTGTPPRAKSRLPADDDEDATSAANGVHMYGAVVLALHGPLTLDTVLSTGYAPAGERIYAVEEAEGNQLVTVSDAVSGDSDEMYRGVAVLQEMVDQMEDNATDIDWEDMINDCMLGVAVDSLKPTEELTASDFTLVPMRTLIPEMGIVLVDADLKPGDRIRLMIRDPSSTKQELRDRLLDVKRRELTAMMSGQPSAQAFGALLFSDTDRGVELFEEENFESRTVSSYFPVPISGMFGSGQIVHNQNVTKILEQTAVLGIFRALGTSSVPVASAEQSNQLESQTAPRSSDQEQC